MTTAERVYPENLSQPCSIRCRFPQPRHSATSSSLWAHGNLFWQLSKDENHMVRVCQAPHPLQNHSLGYLGGWTMPRSAEEKLDGNFKGWMSLPMPELLLTMASRIIDRKTISAESFLVSTELKIHIFSYLPVSPRRPNRSRD